MSIFVIADLHLSFKTNKPMGMFGPNWVCHEEKIADSWREQVKKDDLVVLPGDFSWAMNLEETIQDFEYLTQLPGKKLLLKGNHDYWWTTLAKMRKFLEEHKFENIDFIQNNYYLEQNKLLVGTHGWIINNKEEDMRLLRREKLRIQMQLDAIKEKYTDRKEIIVFMHYPPYEKKDGKIINPYSEIFENYKIKTCYYGHLHGEKAYGDIKDFEYNGVTYRLVSADYLNFKPLKIL